MDLSNFKRHEDGRFFRESNFPDADSDNWVYLLGSNEYLKVMQMDRGWSIFECEDLGFAGSNSEQVARGLNAQEAQRMAMRQWADR